MERLNALVIGGTSGIGEAMTSLLVKKGYHVVVTGRTQRTDTEGVDFYRLSIAGDYRQVATKLDHLAGMARWDMVVYSAGFYQDGLISDLTDVEIIRMMNVGLVVPMLLVKRILQNQETLERLVLVTSTSQFTARAREPAYCATKSGLAMFGRTLFEDKRVRSIMVAAPAGTKSRFWRDSENEQKDYLDPQWVAEEIFRWHFGNTSHFAELHFFKGDSENGTPPKSDFKYSYH